MTLAVENLCAAYGEIEVVYGVNLVVEKGETIALLGANGAGKSTTIKAIMGLVKPSAGRILLDGRDLAGPAAHLAARAGIAVVPEGRKIFKKMTVEENLQVGGVVRSGAEVREQIADVYALFPRLGERRRQVGGTLSGGGPEMAPVGRGGVCARGRPCADVASGLHPDGRAVARACAARGRECAPRDRSDPSRDGY